MERGFYGCSRWPLILSRFNPPDQPNPRSSFTVEGWQQKGEAMSVHDLFAWLVGAGALLYLLVAMLKPEWFLYIPPEQRKAQAEQMRLLSGDQTEKEVNPAPLMKGIYLR